MAIGTEQGTEELREKLEGLSPIEAYTEGRYDEQKEVYKDLLELIKGELWAASNMRLTQGSIGAGSKVYYGHQIKARQIEIPLTVMALGCGVASYLLSLSSIFTALGFIVGLTALTAVIVDWIETEKSKKKG